MGTPSGRTVGFGRWGLEERVVATSSSWEQKCFSEQHGRRGMGSGETPFKDAGKIPGKEAMDRASGRGEGVGSEKEGSFFQHRDHLKIAKAKFWYQKGQGWFGLKYLVIEPPETAKAARV